ncbi:hypothetical protein V4U86_19170 [Mycobacterium sp. AMU20-3851]|uniref:hypothetical protein n=1 Tax=Mycobacterium sp. AMU20-3851 TaxID=3122055 RepID=UPI00375446A4
MGFWHTGYEGFHEPEDTHVWAPQAPKPPVFNCPRCDRKFASRDDLAVHEFDGHATVRPVLTLHGRECGRSRLAVIAPTVETDWTIENARAVHINGRVCDEAEARRVLASATSGVVSLVLDGDVADQRFEFKFDIADGDDLAGVDDGLYDLIGGKSLSFSAIDGFIRATNRFTTARSYRDSYANYFYGVLARERSTEARAVESDADRTRYVRQFDEAVAELGRYERPPAEAISGLVAFHYNQFDLALRKTRSPRIAQVALRFARLLAGETGTATIELAHDAGSLDYVLSDNEIEQVIHWSSIPLDGAIRTEIAEMEQALSRVEPTDGMKLRVVLAEHHLAAGEPDRAETHIGALRHSEDLDKWTKSYQQRRRRQFA